MECKLSHEEAQRALDALRQDYTVYAPTAFAGEGRYHDTDSIRYGEITRFDQIEYAHKAQCSIKELFLPIRHTIAMEINGKRLPIEEKNQLPLAIFLRPCDLHAVERLDKTFATDVFYQKRRTGAKFIIMECGKGWDTCFCVSTGTNIAEKYDAGVQFTQQGALFTVRDEALQPYFASLGTSCTFTLDFVTENEMKVRIPTLRTWDKQTLAKLRALPLWETYAKRCIGCGSCNMACTTCTCLQISVVPCSATAEISEVRRVWNGCQVVHSAARAQHTLAEIVPIRIMQRVLDKFYRPHLAVSKEQLCVGCGRCIDVCPRLINFGETVNHFCAALGAMYAQDDAEAQG